MKMNKKVRDFSLTSVFCGSRDIISDQWEGRRVSRDHQLEPCARGNPSRQQSSSEPSRAVEQSTHSNHCRTDTAN